jgi:hypothetical protein
MKLLDKAKGKIISLERCNAAYIVAYATAAACSKRYCVNLLEVSANLGYENLELVLQLCKISHECDYSNADQDEMLAWLDQNLYLKNVPVVNE